jgi:ribonuclease J
VRACLHRGAREIAGTCVELEHDGARLVLDVGLPLDADDGDVPLPAVAGLAEGDPSLVGVVVSHGHPDHHGLVARVAPSVPVYVGAVTERILRVAAFWSPAGADLRAAGHLDDRVPLPLGPFTVTPYLVDHSTFDSYALLVEAGGRRLLYSGDLRAHGRKPGTVRRLLAPSTRRRRAAAGGRPCRRRLPALAWPGAVAPSVTGAW